MNDYLNVGIYDFKNNISRYVRLLEKATTKASFFIAMARAWERSFLCQILQKLRMTGTGIYKRRMVRDIKLRRPDVITLSEYLRCPLLKAFASR